MGSSPSAVDVAAVAVAVDVDVDVAAAHRRIRRRRRDLATAATTLATLAALLSSTTRGPLVAECFSRPTASSMTTSSTLSSIDGYRRDRRGSSSSSMVLLPRLPSPHPLRGGRRVGWTRRRATAAAAASLDDYEEEEGGGGLAGGVSEEDVVASSSSSSSSDGDDGDDDDSWASPKSKRQPTLAELEDHEEARLAAMERRETEGRRTVVGTTTTAVSGDASAVAAAPPAGRGVPLSNLYADVYSGEISARVARERTSSSSYAAVPADDGDGGVDRRFGDGGDYVPPPMSPVREMEFAKKRDLLQNGRFNEMFAEEDAANADRQDRIRRLMEEDDLAWKAERRRRVLGKYADVGSWEEVEKLLDEDRTKETKGAWFSFSSLFRCVVPRANTRTPCSREARGVDSERLVVHRR